MNKKLVRNLAIIIVVLGFIFVPKLLKKNDESGPGKGKGKSSQTAVITAYEVAPSNMSQSILATGNLLAMQQLELKSEAGGKIIKIGFKEGDKVKIGQLLVKLNDADLKAQLAKLQTSLKLKNTTETRNKQMLEKGGISMEQLELIQNEIAMAKDDISVIEEQIKKTEIYAPFSGTIGFTDITVGTYLMPGSVITTLQQDDELKIEFYLPSKYLSLIKQHEKINFNVESSDKNHEGIVYVIASKVDEKTGSIAVRAVAKNSNHELAPGMFIKVNLNFESDKKSVMVPSQSIVPILKGQKVFKIAGDSVIDQKIQTGIRNDSMVEVLGGLNIGDKIALKGVIQLKQGSKVKVTN
jgi:membrane fusion protein (multidrug efflux system)